MNEEIKIIIKAVTDSAKKAIKEVSGELNGLSKSAQSSSGKVGAAFKGIAKGAAIAVGAVAAIGAALIALGKNSLDTQRNFAKLNTAFEAAGSTAKQAGETYNGLYRFLGDSDKATEAAQSLARITNNQKDLAKWTKIAQGVYATFGDDLSIESFMSDANETINSAEVAGTMADALVKVGISEDAFNAKLAATTSAEEREALVRNTLNDLYSNAAEIYERNNKALLEYNESQARLDTTMAAAGQATMPLLTALNNLGAAFFTALKPALDAIIPPIATFINWIAQAITSVMSFFSALTGKSSSIKSMGQAVNAAANGSNKLASGMKGAEKAADGAVKAVEEAKKSTQGFDELNIVSSGKTSGGGSGDSDGSDDAGYDGVTAGANEYKTEVEEAEGSTNSLAETIKATFGKLADVFEPSISAWSDAFETVKDSWNNAKPDFINGANEIKDGFTTLGSYLLDEFVPNVVNAFSTNLAPMIGDTLGFALEEIGKQFEWLGESFNTAVNDVFLPALQLIEDVAIDIFDSIGSAWQEHGEPLLDNFSAFFENLRGHLDNFYNSVFKPIWDNLLAVLTDVWQSTLKPLWDKLVKALLDIGNEILILYNKSIAPVVNWLLTKIVPIVVEVVNKIVKIVGDILKAVGKVVDGVIDVIKGIVKFIVGVFTGDWKKAWEGIKTIFDGFSKAIGGIIDTIKTIFNGLCTLVKDTVVAAFRIAWEAIKGVWNVAGDFFKGIWDKIKNVFSSVKTWFKDIFQGAWQAVQNVFSNWGSFFSGLWNKIKTTFSSLGTNIANAISGSIKSGINGVISMIEKTINSAIGLINGAIKLINKLPGVSVGRVGTLSLPRLAKGGIVDEATVAMIGEQGKEAVVPLENNTGWMDKLAERIAARQSTPTKVVLQIGEKELGWATIDAINGITRQTGGLQLAL